MLKILGKKLRWLYVTLAITLALAMSTGLVACSYSVDTSGTVQNTVQSSSQNSSDKSTASKDTGSKDSTSGAAGYEEFIASIASLPEYTGSPYIIVNDNTPFFTDDDMTTTSFENYGELDSLGRCTAAYANVGQDLMPTEKRGSISSVKPTGWQTVKYDNVDGKYLYNRCHLIGYQLTAENANKNNLITGTRYLNVDGMLLFENMVADYIKETNNHVLYRVTPIFTGDNLLADGVLMEAESVEDNGEGISYNVFCYNVQPGVKIDYVTGDSSLE